MRRGRFRGGRLRPAAARNLQQRPGLRNQRRRAQRGKPSRN